MEIFLKFYSMSLHSFKKEKYYKYILTIIFK